MSTRIVITGATGFIGSHLVRTLSQAGHAVCGICRPSSNLDPFRTEHRITWVRTDAAALATAFEGADAVVHLAANRGQLDTPLSTIIADNLLFAMQILEAATTCNVPLFVNADTCLDPNIRARAAYALSKKQFVQWAALHCHGRQMQFMNVRFHYVYGPRDKSDKFVPTMIRRCLFASSDTVIGLTAGEQRKDFIYIDDAVAAVQLLLARGSALPPFATMDCGTGTTVSIRELVETIYHITQSRATLRFGAEPYLEGEPMFAPADPTLLATLGWEPRMPRFDGLVRTVQHERDEYAKALRLYSDAVNINV